MKRGIRIFLINLAGVFFILSASSAVINPNSYRHDYYKMPPQEEVQKKALTEKPLNLALPKITPYQPQIVIDEEGNILVYLGGKKAFAISKDRKTITYFANGAKTHSDKIINSGTLYRYRFYIYKGFSGRVRIENENGETLGWEIWGLNGKLLEREDAFGKTILRRIYDSNSRNFWEVNYLNNTWTRYEDNLPKEEHLGAKSGPLLAYWRKGTFFGKSGLWKIEKGWDGEKIVDMYYTLYDEFASEPYEEYHKNGYLVKKWHWKNHTLVLEEDLIHFSYKKYGDFGLIEDKYIENYTTDAIWISKYNGSRIAKSVRIYEDKNFYDERIYDLNGNIDKVVRRDKLTGQIIAFLEDRIYFWEVKDLDLEGIKDFFDVSPDIAEYIYFWKEDMKKKGKSSASLLGIRDFVSGTIVLHNENNLACERITLSPAWEITFLN